MELGATLCTPRSPRCAACPLARPCNARREGDAETLPIKARKKPPLEVEAVVALVLRRGKALAVRRPLEGLLGGLWDLPGDALTSGELPRAGLIRALRERVGLAVSRPAKVGSVEHVFTHRKLKLHVFRCNTPQGRTRLHGFDTHKWLAPNSIQSLPHGAITGKALDLLLPQQPG